MPAKKKPTHGGERPGAGRPTIPGLVRQTTATLDEDTRERARKIGNGNISEGIRIAVQAYRLK